MASSLLYGYINSHLTTSNIYVQREIVLENIKTINIGIQNSQSLHLSYFQLMELRAARRRQNVILATLNKRIADSEQGSFPFGAL